jgi:hypothetical protein
MLVVANKTGAALLPDNSVYENRMEIHSESSSRKYVVAQSKSNGNWSCSCMGWIRHRTCKHLKTMLPLLLTVTASSKNLGGKA